VKLYINLAGDVQLSRTLLRFSDRMRDMRPAFNAIADDLADSLRRNFNTQGTYGGAKWSPLSPKYRVWKAKNYPGRPVLVRTGALRADLTKRPFGVEKITAQSMDVGTALPYFKYHQHGTPRMPRRRQELNEATRRRMVKTAQRFIMTGQV
jgi:phage gpG-like protein